MRSSGTTAFASCIYPEWRIPTAPSHETLSGIKLKSGWGQNTDLRLFGVIFPVSTIKKKRRKYSHLWLIHQLLHPSPTTAKITISQRHPNPIAKITTSQRLHSLLLFRPAEFHPGEGQVSSFSWESWSWASIKVDFNRPESNRLPNYSLSLSGCVWSRALFLSTGKSLTKPACLFKPQQPQSSTVLPPETKNLESLSHWKQDAISTNSAWLTPSYSMPMSEAPSFVSSNACLMCNLIIWLQQHNCVIVMYCASWLEGDGRHLLSDVESREQQQHRGNRRNPVRR